MHAYPCVSGSWSRYVSFLSLYGATSVLFLVAVVVLYASVVGGGMLVEVRTTELLPNPLIVLSFILSSLEQLFIAIVLHKPDNNNAHNDILCYYHCVLTNQYMYQCIELKQNKKDFKG
jgi:hypothetical protein